jgi:hypothetical protein
LLIEGGEYCRLWRRWGGTEGIDEILVGHRLTLLLIAELM